MKLFIRLICLLGLSIPLKLNAQQPVIQQYCDFVTNTIGSFLDNPYHHSNTLKINQLLSEQEKVGKESLDNVWKYQRSEFPYLQNALKIISVFKTLTNDISKGGYLAPFWNNSDVKIIIDPILQSFGWQKRLLCSCQSINVYQYDKDQFKIIMVENTNPETELWTPGVYLSYKLYDINPYTKKLHAFTTRIVKDGHTQILYYKDDDTDNKEKFHNVKKVESRRTDNINW